MEQNAPSFIKSIEGDLTEKEKQALSTAGFTYHPWTNSESRATPRGFHVVHGLFGPDEGWQRLCDALRRTPDTTLAPPRDDE